MVRRGEVVAIETASAGGEFNTVPSAELVDGDKRAQAIVLGSTSTLPSADDDGNFGRLNVVTSGQVPALVLGPCTAGDTLCLAATDTDKANWPTTGKYLKRGVGCFVAMDDVPTPGDGKPVMAWVQVGGAAAATVSASTMTIVTVHNNYLACTDSGGASVNVARPAVNRRDTPEGGSLAPGATVGTRVDNGVTYTLTYSGVQARNVTGGTIGAGGEDQTIGPVQYVAGDVIQVNKTALTVNDDTTGTVDCPWVSVDSRAWGAC